MANKYYYSVDDMRALRAEARRYNYKRLSSFDKASYERLQRICNGIGAEWMPRFVRKLTTRLMLPIEAAACVHDWDYEYLETNAWNFMVANLRLFYNACKSHAPVTGFAAMVICSLFGWAAFKTGKNGASR